MEYPCVSIPASTCVSLLLALFHMFDVFSSFNVDMRPDILTPNSMSLLVRNSDKHGRKGVDNDRTGLQAINLIDSIQKKP